MLALKLLKLQQNTESGSEKEDLAYSAIALAHNLWPS